MKIAAITEDGETISQHFGRAPHYMVVTVDDGRIVGHELRDKLGHADFHDEQPGHESEGGRHGFGPAADGRHGRMAEAIADCEALLCRGMGAGAYESMNSRAIRPVVTDIPSIDEAVMAYVDGHIVDHIDKLH
jgi:predicted Fe-Mo cluster-binding NifX family protein